MVRLLRVGEAMAGSIEGRCHLGTFEQARSEAGSPDDAEETLWIDHLFTKTDAGTLYPSVKE